MQKMDVTVTFSTDWRPSQARQAVEAGREIMVSTGTEHDPQPLKLIAYGLIDDGVAASLTAIGTLFVDLGEAPPLEVPRTSSI